MTMQIRSIVLYNYRKEIRELKFRLGQVNVITGQSRTGKSAIIDIVDYCLGRSTFRVFEGVNRNVVSWYGIILRHHGSDIFIAKPAPKANATSQSSVCLRISSDIDPLPFDQLEANTNDEGLVQQLSLMLRMSPNLSSPGVNHTRTSIQATLEHSKFYLFQEQGEIANRSNLFHRQSEQFLPQAIKDTLPYLLGAVPEERLLLVQEERELRRKLRLLKRRQSEAEDLQGADGTQAGKLVEEARSVGLIPKNPDGTPIAGNREFLRSIQYWMPQDLIALNGTQSQLEISQELDIARARHSQLYDSLVQARFFALQSDNFGSAATDQQHRLHAIDMLPKDVGDKSCPLCGSEHIDLPLSQEIRKHARDLQHDLLALEAQKPRLHEHIRSLEIQVSEAKEQAQSLQQRLQAIVDSEDALEAQRDIQTRVAKVVGRISLYLESILEVAPDSSLSQEIERIQSKLEHLSTLLDQDAVQSELMSIVNRIGVTMTKLANNLKLEFAGSPYRIDLNALTVVADTRPKQIPMERMGSGENWLGCHLAALLAIHKHFIENDRPVPGFLIIDQPSQVYFPSTSEYSALDGSEDSLQSSDADISAVERMFKTLLDVVQDLSPNLQIIVTEHANLAAPWFQEMLVEPPWRAGRALIPEAWLNK